MRKLKYSDEYKYQCRGDFHYQTSIYGFEADTPLLKLTKQGLITIKLGYACDGPSGPTIDTPIFIFAAFIHDAIYQLIRMGFIPFRYWRQADNEMATAIKFKLNEIRKTTAWYLKAASMAHEAAWNVMILVIMAGLKMANGDAAKPQNIKKVYVI